MPSSGASQPALPIVILGSTGSIGESTLRVVDRYPSKVSVKGLATGSNWQRLAEQARRYNPAVVGLDDPAGAESLRSALSGYPGAILTGPGAVEEVAAWPEVETAVVAIVGFSGVRPTLAAIRAGHHIALANKETLVAAGSLVTGEARRAGVAIAPIDSEHSAIWQCLRAGQASEVRRLILTASGGPFRKRPLSTFAEITPEEALAHPTWKMGSRITIDSATMMNKGFEIIEAAWLFDVKPTRIDVAIHPQSIVHSMVEFMDNSVIAQLGPPDMTLPIAYALFGPSRPLAPIDAPRLDISGLGSLEFEVPDPDRYPALELARRAFAAGSTAPTVLNAADEVAVAAFLDGRIRFPAIVDLAAEAVATHSFASRPSIDDITEADMWAREFVNQRVRGTYTLQRVPADS